MRGIALSNENTVVASWVFYLVVGAPLHSLVLPCLLPVRVEAPLPRGRPQGAAGLGPGPPSMTGTSSCKPTSGLLSPVRPQTTNLGVAQAAKKGRSARVQVECTDSQA